PCPGKSAARRGEGRTPGSPPDANHWMVFSKGLAPSPPSPPVEGALPAGGERISRRRSPPWVTSHAVVHLVFERMGRSPEARDLQLLKVDVAVDEVVAHHPAGLEELAVGVERGQRLVEAGAHLRDLLFL